MRTKQDHPELYKWAIDETMPYKCMNGKAGGTERFLTLQAAIEHFTNTTGMMMVSGWENGKFKIFKYRYS